MAAYSPAWNLFLVFTGLIDPVYGVFVRLATIFHTSHLLDRADTPQRRRRGVIIVLGGVEGPSFFNQQMVVGLLRSRYRGAVVRIDWNGGLFLWRSIVNLMSRRHHDEQARRVAEFILDYRRQYREAPISIVAQSGGCWIAIRALQCLPQEVQIETAALLAPAMSSGYDHSAAVSRCRRGLLSLGGPGDFFFLGLGTMLLGTSDRVFSPSAGLVGWHYKPAGFVEARWHPEWLRHYYVGNHTSSATAGLIAHVVAPWLCRDLSSVKKEG